jgi:lipopolysaccharide/colanic/teichoic acid biosynthesis glycosyltransferase
VSKRIADVLGGAVLIVLATPVIVVAALISLAAYRRWPFFVQTRVGRDERPFRLVKVRTLAPSTPANVPKAELEAHRPGGACRFLRAHHIDELPQLLHVLRGTMSLVGPRPEMERLHRGLPVDFARLRTQVRPGITGLWQISQAVEGMISDHPEYDRYYVANARPRLDAWILWRTLGGLVGRPLLASLDDLPGWVARGADDVTTPVGGVPV